MATVTSVTKHFPSAEEGFSTTLASTVSSGATTVPLNSVAGYTNGEVVVFVVDPTNVSKKQAFTGTIDTGGVQVTNVIWTEGTNQDHTAGATVVDYATATHISMMTKGILVHANQDGTLITQAVKDALGITDDPTGGWSILNSGTAPTVSTGYNKGNKEFDLTFSTVDLSSTLSPGMRLKLDRTGTTPTQCTDLESSSSQYWSKSSPSGITFTDDFTCEAWVKLESYGTEGGIVARRNADTEGWSMSILSTGQLRIQSLRIASNNRAVDSNQSIPLNRWVHVAATMDNSANTHTMYIDGVAVSTTTATNGTITALVQGTTALVVGALKSAGTSPFDGEIADVRVWSAVRTATQIRDNMNQQLVGNESNLVAYFPFNGNANDLTSNANNLSANGGASATTVDNPMKSTEYAIITKVAYSAPNTTVTVFTGTDHNIPNMTLANPFYSTQATPFGFPRGREKWIVICLDTSDRTTSATTPTNVGSVQLSVPTGAWRLTHYGTIFSQRNATTFTESFASLSTSTTAVDDSTMIIRAYSGGASGNIILQQPFHRTRTVNINTQTPYYQLLWVTAGGMTATIAGASSSNTVIEAECAYL